MDFQPFSLNDLGEREGPEEKEEKSISKKGLIIGIGTVLIILLLGVIITLLLKGNDKEKDENGDGDEDEDEKEIIPTVLGEINCVFELEENINIKILSDEFEKNSSFDIFIDKEKIEYTKVYKFNTTGG